MRAHRLLSLGITTAWAGSDLRTVKPLLEGCCRPACTNGAAAYSALGSSRRGCSSTACWMWGGKLRNEIVACCCQSQVSVQITKHHYCGVGSARSYLTAAPLCPRCLSCSAGAVFRQFRYLQGRGNVKCAGLAAHSQMYQGLAAEVDKPQSASSAG